MFDFVHGKISEHLLLAENQRLKVVKIARWRKHQNIHRWIILFKLIYAMIFLCLTISFYLNRSSEETIFIRMFDLWFAFLSLILLFSLLLDRLKRHKRIPLKIINGLQISLAMIFIIIVIIGHIESSYRLWWTSSSLLSIVFVDICPIVIVLMMSVNSLKKHRSWRRIEPHRMISNV